ncbi:hypothetical protein CTAYLR_002599 [Chrysophaeum taylorii]|uniref:non-specific serine/threonine protein kinase n=1 Tax=Chrysophaeum taylorii TaxID=2483200 RepID=A0AAD7XKF7_9STRA|nr:hypothetical protein CTAYLR_002599 [Chrysophaeum taylorii]
MRELLFSEIGSDDFASSDLRSDNAIGTGLPTTHRPRCLGVGNLCAGHLVRLPTTGRPVFEVVFDFIGQGGYGEVYVVRSMTRAATLFAMKRVRSDKLGGASSSKKTSEEIRLCRGEALLMAQLGTHPHVVSLNYGVVSSTADFLLFTTLVDGARDLERLVVSSGDLYDGDTRGVRESISMTLRHVASALAFCRGCGVLHQDVKLENIYVDTAGRAFLGDFGLASHGDGVHGQLRAPLEGCTRAYASPEVIGKLDVSSGRYRDFVKTTSPAETDIWASFGICLAADATQRPACGATLLEAMQIRDASVLNTDVDTRDVSEMLLNIGRAAVELNDVGLACTALEAAAEKGGDAAECYSLLAGSHIHAGNLEQAVLASEKAIRYDPVHGAHQRDLSSADSQFIDVMRQARLYDAKLFAAPRTEKGEVTDLETAPRIETAPRTMRTRRAIPSRTTESRYPPFSEVVNDFEGVYEAAMRTGRVVIDGDAGKGWVLRALVVALYDEQVDHHHERSGCELGGSSASDDLIGSAIDKVRDDDGGDALRAARIDRRLVLCLDGLDEVAPTTRPSIVEKIVECAQNCALTIITTRPAAEKNVGDFAPHGFAFLRIFAVDRRRVETLGIPRGIIASHVETPLALRLAMLALSSTGELQPPPVLRDRSDLFRVADEGFMTRAVVPTRQDGALVLARNDLRECGSLEVREIFERLALLAHQERRTSFKCGDFEALKPSRLAAAVWSLARSGLLPPLAPSLLLSST